MALFIFILGLCLLFLGGEFLIRGAVALARSFGVPPLVIGLTIVGFGTSAPELLVSLQAALGGTPDIAVGNVLGSNIANVLLILGLTAAVLPVPVAFARLRRDLMVMAAASALLALMLQGASLTRGEGLILLTALGLYLWRCLGGGPPAALPAAGLGRPVAFALAAGGLVMLVLGARLMVDSATDMARALGVSEAVIGLTIVAIGTSLPELTTSLLAARRGQSEIAVGNVIGSNIFNILGILGTTALVQPIPVNPAFRGLDLGLTLVAAAGLVAVSYLHDRISRRTGALMVAAYGFYLLWLVA